MERREKKLRRDGNRRIKRKKETNAENGRYKPYISLGPQPRSTSLSLMPRSTSLREALDGTFAI